MPQLVIQNGAQLRLIWTIGTTGQMVNVIGLFTLTGAVVTQAIATQIGTAVKTGVTASGLITHLHPSVSLVNVGLRDLRSGGLPEFLDTAAIVTGTGTGDPLPRGTALVQTLRTAQAGARYRGRIFWGGFTEADNDTAGNASSALSTAIQSMLGSIANAVTPAQFNIGVLSRPAPRRTIVTTTYDSANNITSQRTQTQNARPGGALIMSAAQIRNLVWDSQKRRTAPGSVSTLFGPMSLQTFNETGADETFAREAVVANP